LSLSQYIIHDLARLPEDKIDKCAADDIVVTDNGTLVIVDRNNSCIRAYNPNTWQCTDRLALPGSIDFCLTKGVNNEVWVGGHDWRVGGHDWIWAVSVTPFAITNTLRPPVWVSYGKLSYNTKYGLLGVNGCTRSVDIISTDTGKEVGNIAHTGLMTAHNVLIHKKLCFISGFAGKAQLMEGEGRDVGMGAGNEGCGIICVPMSEQMVRWRYQMNNYEPRGMTVFEQTLIVLAEKPYLDDAIYQLDLETGACLTFTPLPVQKYPARRMGIHCHGKLLYFAHPFCKKIAQCTLIEGMCSYLLNCITIVVERFRTHNCNL
jgi:hypothetical protein